MTTSMRSYLAECFWPGVQRADLEELDHRVTRSLTGCENDTEQPRYRGSMLMPLDEVVLCFFEGTSVAAVEAVARRAGIPFARIVESTGIPAGDSDHPGTTPIGPPQITSPATREDPCT
jgi:Protein of unknown function (DUF4242)